MIVVVFLVLFLTIPTFIVVRSLHIEDKCDQLGKKAVEEFGSNDWVKEENGRKLSRYYVTVLECEQKNKLFFIF